MKTCMRSLSWFSLLLLCSCQVAPLMDPAERLGAAQLRRTHLVYEKQPNQAVSQYLAYLDKHQNFEADLPFYYDSLGATMDKLSKGGEADVVYLEGIPYYYVEHVACVCQAYLELGRAYLEEGDLSRAERAALNARDLSLKRGYNQVLIAEVNRDAWALQKDVYEKSGDKLLYEWASSHYKLAMDHLLSPDVIAAYHDYVKVKEDGDKQLKQANDAIGQLNAARQAEVMSAINAGVAATSSVLNTLSQTQIQAAVAKRGFMTQSEQLQMTNLKINETFNQMVLQYSLPQAGKFGDAVAFAYAAASPTLINQLSNPSAGIQPTKILEDFTRRAKELGRGDSAIVKGAESLGAATEMVDSARHSNPAAMKTAMDKFIPAYDNFFAALQKTHQKRAQGGGAEEDKGQPDTEKGGGHEN